VLAATAVALEFKIPLQDIVARVKTLAPVARAARSRAAVGARLVDDSYNASPAAMMMLAALAATPTSGRRIAVLGEMLELGDQAIALHDASGAPRPRGRRRAGRDRRSTGRRPGRRRGGGRIDRARIHRFADSARRGPVARLVAPGDLVLVKGSHGTRTDLVADRLKEGA
jgi:UDP-N-acetylmuramoyl-tripeptide--D-alanyl-D-alanine ligase